MTRAVVTQTITGRYSRPLFLTARVLSVYRDCEVVRHSSKSYTRYTQLRCSQNYRGKNINIVTTILQESQVASYQYRQALLHNDHRTNKHFKRHFIQNWLILF